MTPRDLDDPQRRTHEIDEHVRIYVNDLPDTITGDDTDSRIIVTDKTTENYECTHVSGIQSSYNAVALRDLSETGDVGTKETVYLRNAFCSCDNCRSATKPQDYTNCRYEAVDSALHCTSPHCTAPHLTALHCVSLHSTVHCRTALHCISPHSTVHCRTALHCTTPHSTLHCRTPPHRTTPH